ncbi:MAG: serine O-acetyltransferase [Candidatus Omnitrophica bacterium]|nr:serine O-acetyltransferase [Candidatus Omnitrophota bacterium]
MKWLWTVFFVLSALLALKVFIYSFFFSEEIQATLERDPAATSRLAVILMYPGLHAIFYHRVAHRLYGWKIPLLPRLISQMARALTGIEIHPGAVIGKGLFIDHGMGVVIGETSIMGNNVTLFQGVTLGGTGKEKGKRHPTLGDNVVVGTGACVLGNIRIGDNVNIGANAVVVRDVPSNSTVVGVPGRIASRDGRKVHGINLDHTSLPDPLAQALEKLQHEIDHIEKELKEFEHSEKHKRHST